MTEKEQAERFFRAKGFISEKKYDQAITQLKEVIYDHKETEINSFKNTIKLLLKAYYNAGYLSECWKFLNYLDYTFINSYESLKKPINEYRLKISKREKRYKDALKYGMLQLIYNYAEPSEKMIAAIIDPILKNLDNNKKTNVVLLIYKYYQLKEGDNINEKQFIEELKLLI